MKRNPLILPAVAFWIASALLAVAYLKVPLVARCLEPLMYFQSECGAFGAFVNRVVFCAVLPAFFWLIDGRLRPDRPWASFVAQALWAGTMGVICDAFFTLQAGWFGEGNAFSILIRKTLVDQFVWTVVFITPMNVLFYSWAGRGFPLSGLRLKDLGGLYREKYVPILVSNWCVWIPVILAVYAFPTPLQIQVSGFACAFWSLLCFRLGKKKEKR